MLDLFSEGRIPALAPFYPHTRLDRFAVAKAKRGSSSRCGIPSALQTRYFPCALQESNLNAPMRVFQLKLPLVL